MDVRRVQALLGLVLALVLTHPANAASTPPTVAAVPAGMTVPCGTNPLAFGFDPTAAGYTRDNAYWQMWMTLRAYVADSASTRAELASVGFHQFTPISHPLTGLHGFVAANDQIVIVAFAGSVSTVDWLIDGTFALVDGEPLGVPGKVHAGFGYDVAASWDAIRTAVDAFGGGRKPIWVTGHSLGGALATVTAYRLAGLGYPIGPLYTFAAPRAGDQTFTTVGERLIGGQHYRITNVADMVPHIPPRATSARWLRDLSLGPLGSLLGDVFQYGVNYVQGGHEIQIEPSRGDSLDLTDDVMVDDAFWQDISELVVGIANPAEAIKVIQARQESVHGHLHYFCLLQDYRQR